MKLVVYYGNIMDVAYILVDRHKKLPKMPVNFTEMTSLTLLQ